MTPEFLSALVAILLSLLFSYIPGFETWYSPLEGVTKRLIMLALLFLVSLVSFGLTCAGWAGSLQLSLTCDTPSLVTLLRSFVAALAANQSMYAISPRKA